MYGLTGVAVGALGHVTMRHTQRESGTGQRIRSCDRQCLCCQVQWAQKSPGCVPRPRELGLREEVATLRAGAHDRTRAVIRVGDESCAPEIASMVALLLHLARE